MGASDAAGPSICASGTTDAYLTLPGSASASACAAAGGIGTAAGSTTSGASAAGGGIGTSGGSTSGASAAAAAGGGEGSGSGKRRRLNDEDIIVMQGLTGAVQNLAEAIKAPVVVQNNEPHPDLYMLVMGIPGFTDEDLMTCLTYLFDNKSQGDGFVKMEPKHRILWLRQHLARFQ